MVSTNFHISPKTIFIYILLQTHRETRKYKISIKTPATPLNSEIIKTSRARRRKEFGASLRSRQNLLGNSFARFPARACSPRGRRLQILAGSLLLREFLFYTISRKLVHYPVPYLAVPPESFPSSSVFRQSRVTVLVARPPRTSMLPATIKPRPRSCDERVRLPAV